MYGACIVWYECLAADVVGAFLDDADAAPNRGANGNERGEPAPSAAGDDPSSVAPTDQGSDSTRGAPEAHAPEAICLLSRVPVFSVLMDCCRQLFRMRISSDGPLPASALTALRLSLSRACCYLVDVP